MVFWIWIVKEKSAGFSDSNRIILMIKCLISLVILVKKTFSPCFCFFILPCKTSVHISALTLTPANQFETKVCKDWFWWFTVIFVAPTLSKEILLQKNFPIGVHSMSPTLDFKKNVENKRKRPHLVTWTVGLRANALTTVKGSVYFQLISLTYSIIYPA